MIGLIAAYGLSLSVVLEDAYAMPNFTIEHLSEERMLEAWPILRASGTEPVPEWWKSEAKALIGRGGGVLVARAANNSIHGLAVYEPVERPRAGRVLAVDKLITFELSRKEPVKLALSEALERLASALGCCRVDLPIAAKGMSAISQREALVRAAMT